MHAAAMTLVIFSDYYGHILLLLFELEIDGKIQSSRFAQNRFVVSLTVGFKYYLRSLARHFIAVR